MSKPGKKNDAELWKLIDEKIANFQYIFSDHAKSRQKERFISDLDVLHILKRIPLMKTKRNKTKDSYQSGRDDWNYCIEGYDISEQKIRILLSFNNINMLIITVIRLT